jgi:hypothetical protein
MSSDAASSGTGRRP